MCGLRFSGSPNTRARLVDQQMAPWRGPRDCDPWGRGLPPHRKQGPFLNRATVGQRRRKVPGRRRRLTEDPGLAGVNDAQELLFHHRLGMDACPGHVMQVDLAQLALVDDGRVLAGHAGDHPLRRCRKMHLAPALAQRLSSSGTGARKLTDAALSPGRTGRSEAGPVRRPRFDSPAGRLSVTHMGRPRFELLLESGADPYPHCFATQPVLSSAMRVVSIMHWPMSPMLDHAWAGSCR